MARKDEEELQWSFDNMSFDNQTRRLAEKKEVHLERQHCKSPPNSNDGNEKIPKSRALWPF